MTLALFGVYSVWGVAAVLAGYSALAAGVRVAMRQPLPRPSFSGIEITPAIVLPFAVAIIAGVMLLRPFENVLLFQDPSVYLDSGMHISKTGQSTVDDSLYYSLSPATRTAFTGRDITGDGHPTQLRGHGLLVDTRNDRTVPQFFQFTPGWIAIFDSLFGHRGALYAIPLLAVLATVLVYAAAARLFGIWAGAIAALLLIINPAQIWWGRNHDSDIVVQLLLFGGIVAWNRYEATKRAECAAVAGFVLGAIALARVDVFLVLAPVAAFLIWQALRGRWELGMTAFAAAMAPVVGVGAIFALTFEQPYTRFQYHSMHNGIMPLLYAAIAIVVVAIVAAAIIRPRRIIDTIRNRDLRRALWAIAAAIVVAAFAAYFIRPLFEPASTGDAIADATRNASHESLVRLGWYLTAPGLIATVVGFALIIVTRPTRPVALFLLLVMTPTIFYLQNPRVSPDQIWASRRFIAATIPAAAIAIGFLVAEASGLGRWRPPRSDLARYGAPIAAYALALAVVALSLRASSPLIRHVEQQGSPDQVRAIANAIPQDAVVIVSPPSFGSDLLAPTLKLLYGRDTYAVNYDTPPAAIDELIAAAATHNRPVYILAGFDGLKPLFPLGPTLTLPPRTYTKTADISFDAPVLDLRFDGIPTTGTRLQLVGALYRLDAPP